MKWPPYMLQTMTKPKGPKTDKPTSVSLTKATMERVEAFRDRHNMSFSDFVEYAAIDFLNRVEDLPAFDELLTTRQSELAEQDRKSRRK